MNTLGKFSVVAGVVLALLMVAILLGGLPFVTVDKGHVGVKTRFGKVIDGALSPGLQWKTPFIERVFEINIQKANARQHSQAASNDLQKVDTDVSVLYALTPAIVPKGFEVIGDREAIESTIIEPAIKETFKAVNAHYTAEELISKRTEVSQKISDELKHFVDRSCQEGGVEGLIRIDNVAIEDFRFSAQFDQSIEAKVTAEQEALRAKEEKQRTITEAEAAKEKVRLESEAEALQITNQAEAKAKEIELLSIARAEAIEREAKALADNPNLIELRKIETWDGKLPTFTGGGAIPFFDVQQVAR